MSAIVYPGWPSCAKAVIEHEFDTDHLSVWLTFSDSMNILKVPLITDFVPFLDNVVKAFATIEWIDHYTLLLTIADVGSLPDRVLIDFPYPVQNLVTYYGKQWEPWADILSIDITT